MKRSDLSYVFASLLFGMVFSNCTSPAEKVENAQNNVIEANKELDSANAEYARDIENYRKVTAERTAANDKLITDFKESIKNDKQEIKEKYNEQVDALQRKNDELKKQMNEYKENGKENWKKFKVDFNKSMDELGKSLKDLAGNGNKLGG